MGSDMVFEEVDLETALGPATPQELLQSINSVRLLWEIGADSEAERRAFARILQQLKGEKTLSVSIQKLQELGINPARTPLIRKLISNGYATIENAQLTLLRPEHNTFTLKKVIRDYNTLYHKMRMETSHKEVRFPTRGWKQLPLSEVTTIELSKINWVNLNNTTSVKELLEITFPSNRLPSVLIPRDQYNKLQEISLQKVTLALIRLAGEKPDFFSERVKFNQNMVRGKANRVLEHEISQINRKTSRGYREEYTRIVLEKILKSPDNTMMLISDLSSETNNHILTEFSYGNPKNFDFLQSFEYLKTIFLENKEMTHITLNSLVSTVVDDLKLYTTEEQLKWDILGENPELSEEKYHEVYNRFIDEFVRKSTPSGIPKIISYHLKFSSGEEENMLIHSMNLSRLLEISINKLNQEIPKIISRRWYKDLGAHNLKNEMFSPGQFRKALLTIIEKNDERFFRLICKPSLYRYLYNMENLSPSVERLKIHGTEKIENVFRINKEELYQQTLELIISEYSPLKGLFFKLVHWFSKKQLDKSPKKRTAAPKKKTIPVQETSAGKDFLSRFGLSGETELKRGLEECWNELPKSGLKRSDLDVTVQAELNAFFGEKTEVPAGTLQVVIDSNTMRILKAAPHLKNYEQALKQYIKLKVINLVYFNTRLKNRCRL